MQFIKNHKLLLLFSIIYFISRFTNLTILPIFNDEAIYLDWGHKSLHLPNNLFFSLYDAKQPLLIWLFGIVQEIISDPLVAGRGVSIAAGFLTLVGLYTLGKKLFSISVGYIAVFCYIINPFFLFFDRQALMESTIACIGVWACYFFLHLQKTQQSKWSILLGTVLGIGFLVKGSSIIFIMTILVISLSLLFYKKKNLKGNGKNIFLIFIFVFGINTILFSQKIFWQTLYTNNRFSFTLQELLNFPILQWIKNLREVGEIAFWHLTPVVFFLTCFGIVLFLFNKKSNERVIVSLFVVTILFVVLLTRNIMPRYVVSFFPLVCLFSASALHFLWKKYTSVSVALGFLAFVSCLFLSVQLAFSPYGYFLSLEKVTAFSQKEEYVTMWPSGYGVVNSVTTIKMLAKDEKIYVGVRPDAGNPESAMFAYFNGSKLVQPTYINSTIIHPWADYNNNCIRMRTAFYFVSRENETAGLDMFFEKEIETFYKPEKKSYIKLYKIKTCPEKISFQY